MIKDIPSIGKNYLLKSLIFPRSADISVILAFTLIYKWDEVC